jgi:hypothetical protein
MYQRLFLGHNSVKKCTKWVTIELFNSKHSIGNGRWVVRKKSFDRFPKWWFWEFNINFAPSYPCLWMWMLARRMFSASEDEILKFSIPLNVSCTMRNPCVFSHEREMYNIFYSKYSFVSLFFSSSFRVLWWRPWQRYTFGHDCLDDWCSSPPISIRTQNYVDNLMDEMPNIFLHCRSNESRSQLVHFWCIIYIYTFDTVVSHEYRDLTHYTLLPWYYHLFDYQSGRPID